MKTCVGATACFCCVVDMGHCGTGTISVSGRGILSGCGLLRAGLRCICSKHIQIFRQLAR